MRKSPKSEDAGFKQSLEALKGKAAIANSKLAYEKFTQLFATERFAKLREQGAHPQRMLWASTSTKNPSYRDVMYVEELIGPETVNTMPPQTVIAFGEHGKVERTIDKDVEAARQVVANLEAIGISMEKVTEQLLTEGVKSFADSFSKLLEGVESKRQQKEVEVA